MGVIGGIFSGDMAASRCNDALAMSRAMMARGGLLRRCYTNKGVTLFSGSGHWDGGIPLIAIGENDGGRVVVAVDGLPTVDRISDFESYSRIGDGAQTLLVGYLRYGNDLWEHIKGEFAAAIYDERQGELTLARDRKGSRPLFFARDGFFFAFASEIKGLTGFLDGAVTVDRTRLAEHILSPCERLGAGFYEDIYEIPQGGGLVLSRLGAHFFDLPKRDEPECEIYENKVMDEIALSPDVEELRGMLQTVLFSYDQPQFDAYMPSFIKRLSTVRRGDTISDSTVCMNIAYSNERRDRLCSYYGNYVRCISPSRSKVMNMRGIERGLDALLSEYNSVAIARIFGDKLKENVLGERNIARRIRMKGMLYQTLIWDQVCNIVFK